MTIASGMDTVQAARRRYFAEGGVPEGLVAEPILRSWQRCTTQGLDVAERPRIEAMSAGRLKLVQEENEVLRRITRPEMTALRAEARLTDSIVILTDRSGLVLDMVGNAEFAGRASRVALRPGVAWSEAAIGTNAIGTALVERRPIGVHGGEHFYEPHRILTCAAAPILDPRGALVGVLDMSGHASVRHVHALGLVRLAVEQIEHRLFERGFEGCRILRFQTEAELIGTASEAILVFEGERLVAANRRGLRFGRLDWSALGTASMAEMFEPIGKAGELHSLRSRTGEAFVGRFDPAEPRGAPARRARPSSEAGEPIFGAETRAALARAVRLVAADVPVLVHGETGTGKEVFARRVHAESERRDRPFVAVNCAALPEGLIESELFGYEEGAFTGARRQGRSGLLRQAEGGILFLDEIGDMPLPFQARLLRALQDKQVVPLGGGEPVKVDFALLCATHRPLSELVAEGAFRSDLYFRIAQYVVDLPPLRDLPNRRDVIHRAFAALGGEASLGDAVLDALAAYEWPGNFRQLIGMLKALNALSEPGEPLRLDDLPAEITQAARSASPAPSAPEAEERSLSQLTEAAMRAALDAADGNVSLAARRLGVDRTTLYRRVLWAKRPG